MAVTTTLERRMVDAYQAGRDAAANGEDRDNPWRSDAEGPVDRTLSLMWARGYSAGNPIQLDADLPE